jgi:Ca2+-binding EF-hand superfamily protein
MDMMAVASSAARSRSPTKKAPPRSATGETFGLTQEEMKMAKGFFRTFDRDSSGQMDSWELQLAMQSMGLNPSMEEITNVIIPSLDKNGNSKVDMNEFIQALVLQKQASLGNEKEEQLVSAYVALGGNPDKSGSISGEWLRKVIKEDFGLLIKIDEILEEADANKDGLIGFEEFAALLR